MRYATKQNTKLGDIVLIPINNEFMHDEQICIKYEIVLAFKSVVKPKDQIVGTNQEPLPELIPFNDEIALLK